MTSRCAGLACHLGAVIGRGCPSDRPCPLETLAERGVIAYPARPPAARTCGSCAGWGIEDDAGCGERVCVGNAPGHRGTYVRADFGCAAWMEKAPRPPMPGARPS